MKISIVTHNYPTKQNKSSGIFIQKEAHQLSELYQITLHLPKVYSFSFNTQHLRNLEPVEESFPIYQFKYISIPRRKLPFITQWSLSKKLLPSIQKATPDIVHLHGLFPAGLSVPALKVDKQSLALTIHGSDWYTNLRQNKLPEILYHCLKQCDLIITVGNELQQDICKSYPELKNKIHFVPHGIDTKKFSLPASKYATKELLAWNPNKINLLCVANLFEVKGVQVLLKAFNNLNDKENYHLHIISSSFDKGYKDEVHYFIKKNNLGKHITFYGGMPEEEIIKYYQAADLLISPSLKEAFGLAIAESAACGTPIIATKSGGPESIVSDEIGSLVSPNDVEGLSQEIQVISKNLEKFIPQKMHNSIVDRYSISAKQQNMKNLYQSIL